MKFRHAVLRILPAIMLACSLLSAQAWAQFTQQGPKLVGTGALGPAAQGPSVSLSADGNTAIIGAIGNNSSRGAAYVFTCTGTPCTWKQQQELTVADGAGEVLARAPLVSLAAVPQGGLWTRMVDTIALWFRKK